MPFFSQRAAEILQHVAVPIEGLGLVLALIEIRYPDVARRLERAIDGLIGDPNPGDTLLRLFGRGLFVTAALFPAYMLVALFVRNDPYDRAVGIRLLVITDLLIFVLLVCLLVVLVNISGRPVTILLRFFGSPKVRVGHFASLTLGGGSSMSVPQRHDHPDERGRRVTPKSENSAPSVQAGKSRMCTVSHLSIVI